ncbi:hypothetical protein VTK56DRAFT_2022 [Thermocarpiscus australiensis]
MTLVYSTVGTSELKPVSTVGACSPLASVRRLEVPLELSLLDEPRLQDAYYSSAPLKDVVHVRVFCHEQTGFCRGILLGYENGAQRALGECRVGVDRVTVYARPVLICFRNSLENSEPRAREAFKLVTVECTSSAEHSHRDEGWECCSLPSALPLEVPLAFQFHLAFWFTHEEAILDTFVQVPTQG